MRLPCEIALKPEELAQALARHSDKDVILVDTAGKSPYDSSNIVELEEWFAPCPTIAPYLVLNATAQKENHARVISTYSRLGLKGLVLSKLDETQAYAGLCQEVATSALPVACLCTGQRVPEDFQMASRPFLEKLFNQGHAALVADSAVQNAG
jgi:flagellar biosynthesis protein FlhF